MFSFPAPRIGTSDLSGVFLFCLKLYFVYTNTVFRTVKLSRDFFILQSVVILHKVQNAVREVDFHKKWYHKTSQIAIFVIFPSHFSNVTVILQKTPFSCAHFPPRLYSEVQRWTVQFHQTPSERRRGLPKGRSDFSWMGVRRTATTAAGNCKARQGGGERAQGADAVRFIIMRRNNEKQKI